MFKIAQPVDDVCAYLRRYSLPDNPMPAVWVSSKIRSQFSGRALLRPLEIHVVSIQSDEFFFSLSALNLPPKLPNYSKWYLTLFTLHGIMDWLAESALAQVVVDGIRRDRGRS